ncbi:MAG: hypothetical protein VX294_08460 [Candidatus Latescibacterota bacterium]|nr:hypothetical protein [Candidatus Latescibacterota bacterium]
MVFSTLLILGWYERYDIVTLIALLAMPLYKTITVGGGTPLEDRSAPHWTLFSSSLAIIGIHESSSVEHSLGRMLAFNSRA